MELSFEQALIEVWRQTLVENVKTVELALSVTLSGAPPSADCGRWTSSSRGNEMRGLEQNPQTKSRWAEMARSGKKVMQFLSEGRYLANVVDGKVTIYGGSRIIPEHGYG
jgi:hypothetical protein